MPHQRHHTILVINPGSTSIKVALFQEAKARLQETLNHPPRAQDDDATARNGAAINALLTAHGIDLATITAIAARGGLLPPCRSGTYLVDATMLAILRSGSHGVHASNQGAIIAAHLADQLGVPAYIVDPVTVDEITEVARLTGLPMVARRCVWHALNQKAVARLAAQRLRRPYQACNLIIAHLGGGLSVAAHRRGRAIEVTNALDGEGPFAMERSGGLPARALLELARTHSADELRRLIAGGGGVVAHLGTNDMREAQRRADGGDADARRVIAALAYKVAREIGACGAVLRGQVDAIALTGGLAHNRRLMAAIARQVRHLGPVWRFPGEREMEALALGALRVLRGQEAPRRLMLGAAEQQPK